MQLLTGKFSFASLFRRCIDVTGLERILGGPQVFAATLRALRIELKRVALDQQLAAERGESMACAVRDFDKYPALAKFHTALGDALRWQMPKRLCAWCRPLFASNPKTEHLMEILLEWAVASARSSPDPDVRATCRILLFETVHLGLILQAELEQVERRIVDDDSYFSVVAEQALSRWLDDDAETGANVVARALESAARVRQIEVDEIRLGFGAAWQATQEAAEKEAQRHSYLGEMDIGDALLLRNATALEWQEQRLSWALLRERHQVAFGGMTDAAMAQQWHRLKERAEREGISAVRRKAPALIDIARDALASA